jgi:hypothetical protein
LIPNALGNCLATVRYRGRLLSQNSRMTRIRPGEPGHGGNQATLRLRPVLIINGEPVDGWTSQWEIICPACGDEASLDYRTVSPYLQKVRGPHGTEAEGQAALRRHRGLPAPARRMQADEPASAGERVERSVGVG